MSGSGSGQERAVQVQEQIDDDVLSEARSAGVDVDSVIATVLDQYADYDVKVQARFATSQINQQLDAADADKVRGLIAGSRDRYGANWPRRWSILRSDGDHMEVSTWSGKLATPDGVEKRIPKTGVVEMAVEHDAEYDSYEGEQLVGVREMDGQEYRENVEMAARRPSELSRDDEYEIVAVAGRVAYVDPQTIFEDGDPQGDGDLLMEDENGQAKPHIEITLADDDGHRVRGHIERQRYGNPVWDVTNGERLLNDAMKMHDTPEEQAQFVGQALEGSEVVLVGNVNNIDVSRSNGETRTYIDVGCTAIVEAPDDAPTVTASEAEEQPTDRATDDATGDREPESELSEVREHIETYCDLLGIDATGLTTEMVRENVDKVADDVPDSVISQAIGDVREELSEELTDDATDDAGDDATDDAGDGGGIGSLEQPDGTYTCPADGCLFGGSKAGLFGHVNGEHTDDDPRDWVLAQVGGE